MDIGIVGGSGYGGAELLRLLAAHPTFRVRTVAAGANAGERLGAVFPHLAGTPQAEEVLAPSEPDALDGCELVLLATPHEVSLALAPALLEQGAAVVDLSGAFRLEPEAFEAAYRLDHTAPELAPAVYGLPELFRADLAGARLVASPGCYPTAALLALAPLAGRVAPGSVSVAGLSGTSGAGKGLRADLHVTHAIANAGAYGAPTHRHTPEIAQGWSRLLGATAPVTFVPHLVPMARGLLCTVTADLAGDADPAALRAAYEAAYAAEPFVTLLPAGSWPQTAHVRGGNGAHVAVAIDEVAGRVVASCAIDNLVKGAAGQALQAANVVLEQDESAGLSAAGLYP
jgi:N-acetyl-gamma-glutamyl-phosphate reductase